MKLSKEIEKIEPKHRSLIVAIDGYGGSGKSTLAQKIGSLLNATVVHTDDFAKLNTPGWDYARLIEQILEPILSGESGRYQRYDWDTESLAEWHDVPADIPLIIEGVSSMRDELGEYWDFGIFVECPYDIRLKRGVERDGESMRSQWTDIWIPEEDKYYQSQRPDLKADFIIDGSTPFDSLI